MRSIASRLALLPSFLFELLIIPRSWSGIWAIARQTLTESIRRKVFIVLLLFCLGLVAGAFFLPVIDEGEHRLKLVQSFAFGGTTLFGMLIAVFLAASAVPEDIAERRIFSVLAAPLARSHYLIGRFIGVGMVLGLLVLGICGLSVLMLPLFMRGLSEVDQERLLAARVPISAEELIWSGSRRSLGRPQPNAREPVTFRFRALDRTQLPVGPLAGQLRLDQVAPHDPEQFIRIYKVAIRYRDPTTGKASPWVAGYGRMGQAVQFEGPSEMVSDEGSLDVELIGADPRLRYTARAPNMIVYGARSHYSVNFAKGFCILYAQLLLVAALALAGSTLLTAPVAIVQALFIYLLGNMLDIIRAFAESLGTHHHSPLEFFSLTGDGQKHDHAAEVARAADQMTPAMHLIKDSLLEFCRYFPDFSHFDVSHLLLDRIQIPMMLMLNTVGYAAIYGSLFGLLGLLAFHLRQVDRA